MVRANSLVAAAILFLVPTATAYAQQHRHRGGEQGMMQGEQESGGGMMLAMPRIQAFTPAALLEQTDELGLTDEQVETLTSLRDRTASLKEEAMKAHDSHRSMLMEALAEADPDPVRVKGHFDGAHASMGSSHWADIDAALQAMGVLTEEQRAHVTAGVGGMRQGQGMRHRGGR